MYKQSLHVHSTFCDGADTPEQLVQAALEQGFDSLGFSGHSSMPPERAAAYRAEVRRLADLYRDRLPIFCGLEWDLLTGHDKTGYDYLIGTVHYLKHRGELFGFDRNWPTVRDLIRDRFGGDGMAFAKLYWETLATLPEHGVFDILGHADILCKHGENPEFPLDTADPRYRALAVEALTALAGKIPLFEVNTGAIARGYRTTPYPDPFLLGQLRRLGFGPVVTSDCHDRRYLDCAYGQAFDLLRAAGFREHYVLKEGGFVSEPLD